MDLLPVRTVHLAAGAPPAALAGALRRVIGDAPAAPFAGSCADDRFVITRMNEFRSTIMPSLRGSLAAGPGGGTAVRLRLRPAGTVFVFMGIWLGFLAAAAALIVAARAPGTGGLLLLAPAGLAAFSWYLMAAVFAADARWAVEHLLETVPELRPGVRP